MSRAEIARDDAPDGVPNRFSCFGEIRRDHISLVGDEFLKIN
jgi:hypothetical protein